MTEAVSTHAGTRGLLAAQLAPAPAPVRDRMLADAANLKPGAAAAVGRFFAILKRHGEQNDQPSRISFDLAATSEPTLQALLTALERYAVNKL
jgi:hypothetical protein